MKISLVFLLAALTPSSPAFADTGPISLGAVGCKDREVLAQAVHMWEESDLRAAYEVVKRGFKSGDCRTLRLNTLVYETTPVLSRFARVRAWGDPDIYWIVR